MRERSDAITVGCAPNPRGKAQFTAKSQEADR
jgi:hypothetical protein